MEEVILVNENDEVIGTMEKLLAHETASLHRAISVFIFNSKNELLIQQRANQKYHSGGLSIDAAYRRLQEEMGIQTDLTFKFKFQYKSEMPNGLVEHEVDHIFFGVTDILPVLNPEEVENFKYINLNKLKLDIELNPDHYTSWFLKLIDKVELEMTKTLN